MRPGRRGSGEPTFKSMRTDVSEDAKGDPTKSVPQQPDPTARSPEAEPLLPDEDRDATLADRIEGGPEHAPDDAPPAPDSAPPAPDRETPGPDRESPAPDRETARRG